MKGFAGLRIQNVVLLKNFLESFSVPLLELLLLKSDTCNLDSGPEGGKLTNRRLCHGQQRLFCSNVFDG